MISFILKMLALTTVSYTRRTVHSCERTPLTTTAQQS